ncbi:class I SAM-dependent RNA methyltransferase [Candidatus Peribacteria bacterium]|nr:class I SAM-dependent RNA methyltransferase [Candidatus Peribacteria bacterium]
MTIQICRIETHAYGGQGIAYVEGKALFLPNAVPGQLVEYRIVKRRKNSLEGKLLNVLEPSPHETETPPYQSFGGAPYARVPLETQQQWKREQIFGLFLSCAKLHLEQYYKGILSMQNPWEYRNKMEYSFGKSELIVHNLCDNTEENDPIFDNVENSEAPSCSKPTQKHTKPQKYTTIVDNSFCLGFKKRGRWDIVENLESPTGLFQNAFEERLPEIRRFLESTGLPTFNPVTRQGYFRTLTVRYSFLERQYLIELSTTGEHSYDVSLFANYLQKLFPQQIAGVLHTIKDSEQNIRQTGTSSLVWGRDSITEGIAGLTFQVQIQSFAQPNPAMADRLYRLVADLVQKYDTSAALIGDYYCGTGTIAQVLASQLQHRQIFGVELVPEAVEDAQCNAAINGLHNVRFHCADVRKFLYHHPEYQGQVGTVVVDPPRSGMAKKALLRLLEQGPACLVYISCNAATMARDTATVLESGFRMREFWLVDQFPHTAHMECVAVFTREKEK